MLDPTCLNKVIIDNYIQTIIIFGNLSAFDILHSARDSQFQDGFILDKLRLDLILFDFDNVFNEMQKKKVMDLVTLYN